MNPVQRALRGFVQTFIGVLLSSGVLSALGNNGTTDWSAIEKVLISALAAGVVSILTFVQNALEDNGTIPAIGKAVATNNGIVK